MKFQAAEHQHGATLIEVLIAVLVSSIGLLGVAALTVESARTGQAAYEVTRLGLAAQALIDSMHVNPAGVAAGNYNGAFDATSAADDCSNGCRPAQRAAEDRSRFIRGVATTLPNREAALECAASDPATASVQFCHLTVAWSSHALSSSGTADAERLAWVFTP